MRRIQRGFTFVEVLVAMLILVLAVLAAVSIGDGAVRATVDTREVTRGTWLLQRVMTELETKLETDGVERGCDKKKEGKFEGEDSKYTWATFCYEIDLKLSEAAAQMQDAANKDKDDPQVTQENQIQKLILDTASTYMSKAMRELHAEVYWTQAGKNKRTVSATTHFVRYDMPLQIPGLPGGGANPATAPGTQNPAPAAGAKQ